MSNQNLILIIGSFAVLLVPTFVGIMWASWREALKVIEKNTHAIIRLEERLNRMSDDVKSWQTPRKERHRSLDKDNILGD